MCDLIAVLRRRHAIRHAGRDGCMDGLVVFVFQYMRILAGTLRDPDEIWVSIEPFHAPGGGQRYRVVRRYLNRWVTEDGRDWGLSSFAWTQESWAGLTVFPTGSERYWLKLRRGIRIYRRREGR